MWDKSFIIVVYTSAWLLISESLFVSCHCLSVLFAYINHSGSSHRDMGKCSVLLSLAKPSLLINYFPAVILNCLSSNFP